MKKKKQIWKNTVCFANKAVSITNSWSPLNLLLMSKVRQYHKSTVDFWFRITTWSGFSMPNTCNNPLPSSQLSMQANSQCRWMKSSTSILLAIKRNLINRGMLFNKNHSWYLKLICNKITSPCMWFLRNIRYRRWSDSKSVCIRASIAKASYPICNLVIGLNLISIKISKDH